MTHPFSPSFGLALGGGSFRGFAHVGVIEVLEREGLRPSWLAGTSAGAIAASLVAFGVPAAQMHEAVGALGWLSIAKLRPLAPIGTITNEGLGEALIGILGDARIEDSAVPLRIVATDIATGERVLLDRGPLAPAVRASSCVPGIFTPVEIEGRLLVDGALVENIPVAAARELQDGVVVAVGLGSKPPFSRITNALQVVANAFEIAVRTQSITQLRQADVAIAPELGAFLSRRPTDRAAIIDAGRSSAMEAIPRLREVLAAPERSGSARTVRPPSG